MSARITAQFTASISLLALSLSGCFKPPYNDFQDDHRVIKQAAVYGGIGAGIGAVVGSVAGSTAIGAAVGGVAGITSAAYKNTKKGLIKELQAQDIQLIQYGDTMTLLVPTDRYYLFNSPRLK